MMIILSDRINYHQYLNYIRTILFKHLSAVTKLVLYEARSIMCSKGFNFKFGLFWLSLI